MSGKARGKRLRCEYNKMMKSAKKAKKTRIYLHWQNFFSHQRKAKQDNLNKQRKYG